MLINNKLQIKNSSLIKRKNMKKKDVFFCSKMFFSGLLFPTNPPRWTRYIYYRNTAQYHIDHKNQIS